MTPDSVTLLGARIDAFTQDQVLGRVQATIEAGRSLRIGVVNAAKLVYMQSDPALQHDVSSSDIVLADGLSLVWASRLRPGKGLPERVAGIDLMFGLLQLADRYGYRLFCLGASEAVSLTVADNIARDYPGAIVAGRRNGYFDETEAERVATQIRDARPDILLVAMTSPKKENFMARWGERMGVSIVHGVGGSFDVYAGKVERAPLSWQKLGLEWLYRVKQEPRRLWKRYLITNVAFIWLIAKETLTGSFSNKRS